MRLNRPRVEQIHSDLQCSPKDFGHSESHWSGNLLSRHLAQQYKLTYGPRHCRRLIAQAKSRVTTGTVSLIQNSQASIHTEKPPWSGFSTLYRQEKALARIRQLSTANLPLKGFALSLIDLLAEATDSGEATQAFAVGRKMDEQWIFRDLETMEWTHSHLSEHRRANSDDSAVTGMLIPSQQLPQAPESVLGPAQLFAPRFHEAPSYHELWKHHRVYSGVMNIARSNGQVVGFAPVWKSKNEKPVTQADLQFLRKALPFIAHGIHAGTLWLRQSLCVTDAQPSGSRAGVVTADLTGRVIAIDQAARALFQQPALFDGTPLDAFTTSNLRSGLQYVTAIIRQVFKTTGTGRDSTIVPAARVWWHGTGCVLFLRAVLSDRVSGPPLVNVLVEEHEPASTRERRFALKYGLSHRESQIFHLAKAQTPRKQIAGQLGLSDNTVKTYLRQIDLKIRSC